VPGRVTALPFGKGWLVCLVLICLVPVSGRASGPPGGGEPGEDDAEVVAVGGQQGIVGLQALFGA
jgi:hypothetical protein